MVLCTGTLAKAKIFIMRGAIMSNTLFEEEDINPHTLFAKLRIMNTERVTV